MRGALVLVTALVACGDGIGAPDATVAMDAARGLVRVRIAGMDPGTSHVIFQNADSSLVLATHTNLDGTANAFMAPGGFVTVVVSGSREEIYTWFDVQPGDELVLGESSILPGPLAASFRVTVPDDPGQGEFLLSTTCGSAALHAPAVPTTQVFLSGCSEQHDVLITNNNTFFSNEHYLFVDGVTLAGAVLTIETPFRPVDTARVEVRGAPDGIFDMSVSMMLYDRGFAIQNTLRGTSMPIVDGSGALDLPMMLPTGSTVMMSMQSAFSPDVAGAPRVIRWGPPQAMTSTDLATTALRPYTDAPTYQRTTHALRWSEGAAGANADVLIASWGWFDTARGGNYQWHVLAPRTEDTILQLPVLPFPEFTPGPDAELRQPEYFTSIKAEGGYAKLRTRLPITWTPGRTWPIDSASGTVVIEELGGSQF
jgi:hypothetical protein